MTITGTITRGGRDITDAIIRDLTEAAYSDALTYVALGEEYDTARGSLLDSYPGLETDEINNVMADALTDALKQGVEREDIDPSWL